MNDTCKKCHKDPTERSVKMFESWNYGYCPTCYGRISMRKMEEIPIKPIESLGCEKNPIDCYWTFVTNSFLLSDINKEKLNPSYSQTSEIYP